MRHLLLALASLAALAPSAAATGALPEPAACGGIFEELPVTAGLTVGGAVMCEADALELVAPPAHGTVTFEPMGDRRWTPVYAAGDDAAGQTDTFTFRAVDAEKTSPEFRITVAVQAREPKPPTTVFKYGPAPVISAAARTGTSRTSLPLSIGCDVDCTLAVSVTHGARVLGAQTGLVAGELTLPLSRVPKVERPLVRVTVTATALARATSSYSFPVRLRPARALRAEGDPQPCGRSIGIVPVILGEPSGTHAHCEHGPDKIEVVSPPRFGTVTVQTDQLMQQNGPLPGYRVTYIHDPDTPIGTIDTYSYRVGIGDRWSEPIVERIRIVEDTRHTYVILPGDPPRLTVTVPAQRVRRLARRGLAVDVRCDVACTHETKWWRTGPRTVRVRVTALAEGNGVATYVTRARLRR